MFDNAYSEHELSCKVAFSNIKQEELFSLEEKFFQRMQREHRFGE